MFGLFRLNLIRGVENSSKFHPPSFLVLFLVFKFFENQSK